MRFKGQPEETLEYHAWVAFKPKCGHAVAMAVINADYATAGTEAVTEWLARGWVVEIRSAKWVRKHLNFCNCK